MWTAGFFCLEIIFFRLFVFLIWRNVNMDPVYSFSGDDIDHQPDPVLCDNKFPGFWEMIQMLNDIAADGIVIL